MGTGSKRVYWTLVHTTLVPYADGLGVDHTRVNAEPILFMNKTMLFSIAFWISAASLCGAATIPAGTTLIARTTEPISSHARLNTSFKAELEQNIVVKGKVLLHAGTPVTGVVESSLGTRPVSSTLTVNLKAILIHGRSVPVHTTGAYGLERFKTKRGISVSGREWSFPYRTRIAFPLAQPINL